MKTIPKLEPFQHKLRECFGISKLNLKSSVSFGSCGIVAFIQPRVSISPVHKLVSRPYVEPNFPVDCGIDQDVGMLVLCHSCQA